MKNLKWIGAVSMVCVAANSWGNGFYLGVGGAPQFADFNQNSHIVVVLPVQGLVTNANDASHQAGTGLMGTLFGGYRWNKQRFSVAGELNANASTVQAKSSNVESVHGTSSFTKFSLPYSYGVSVLPGYIYSESTIFFARIGYALGNFRIHTSDVSLANINRFLSGISYGVGVNHQFTQHLVGRAEVSQTSYENTRMIVVTPPATKTTNINPTTSQATLSLIYQFV
jgi:outer membrane immunogenic protein